MTKTPIPVLLFLLSFISIFSASENILIEDLPKEDFQYETFLENYEIYENLINNPINVNYATIEELLMLPYTDRTKAQKIINYRKSKRIHSRASMTNFGYTTEEIKVISPYFTTVAIKKDDDKFYEFELETKYGIKNIENISNKESINSEHYTNNDNRMSFTLINNKTEEYLKMYVGVGNLSNHILAETNNLASSNMIMNITYDNRARGFKAIGGAYQVATGKNLLFGKNLFGSITWLDSSPIKKDNRGIIAYTSMNADNNSDNIRDFYNGGAIQYTGDKSFYGFFPRFIAFGSLIPHPLDKTNINDYGANIELNTPYLETKIGGNIDYKALSNTNRIAGSVYLDTSPIESVNIYTELASSEGTSSYSGASLDIENLFLSSIIYYADTNYLQESSTAIIHRKKDILGVLAGGIYKPYDRSKIQLYTDVYKNITNTELNKRYEARGLLPFDFESSMVDSFETELMARLNDFTDEYSLRSFAKFSYFFLNKDMTLSFKWQNIMNYTLSEDGNMITVNTKLRIAKMFRFNIRYQIFYTDSYNTALYAPIYSDGEIGFINPYYGNGNEIAGVFSFIPSELIRLSLSYQFESKLIYGYKKETSRAGISCEMKF